MPDDEETTANLLFRAVCPYSVASIRTSRHMTDDLDFTTGWNKEIVGDLSS